MEIGLPRVPLALDPLIAEAKRRMHRRRSLLALALLLLGGAAAALALTLRPSSGPGVSRPLGATAHVGKLSISIPRGFHVYTLRGGFGRVGSRFPVNGHVLTDFRIPAHTSITRVLERWAYGRPPANEVALELEKYIVIGPVGPHQLDRLHLPLSLGEPWIRARVGGYRYGDFRSGREIYQVMYWSGSQAPANDRLAVHRALRSIRPTR